MSFLGESIIIHSPLLLILYGVALALNIVALKIKATGYVLPLLSAAIVAGASAFALLLGAQLLEILAVVLVFLIVNLFGIGRRQV